MNIAERIQNLRKLKGVSQEELADKIGVSRQAVSKWESEQSLPDVEKIILLSEYFGITTDYLLKGIDPTTDILEKNVDARIFATVGSVFNFVGLIVSVMMWMEEQVSSSVAVGLIIMAMGCMIFIIGQFVGENKKISLQYFWLVNVWFLLLIPLSCAFNVIQGIAGRFAGIVLSPIPSKRNSYFLYGLCWLIYIVICLSIDVIIVKGRRCLKS